MAIFWEVRAKVIQRLGASDEAAKVQHDAHHELLEYVYEPGDLVIRK